MYCIAFLRIAELAMHLVELPMPDHVPLCWEHDVSGFHLAFNPHKVIKQDAEGQPVPPFSILVAYEDFPIGIVQPNGGFLMAGAEPDLIKAVERAIVDLGHELAEI